MPMTATDAEPTRDVPAPPVIPWWQRWAPFVVGTAAVVGILLAADTAPLDLVRFAAYAVFAVALPGTLVYRALCREPHSFIDDVAMGIAVGLCLELPAWLVLAALDAREWAPVWPAAVLVPFAAVPRLRRYWRTAGTSTPPLGWSWSITAIVVFFTGYLSVVFLERNPVLPGSESTRQYLDLAYQLSLAGEAKHQFPLDVPQLSGEPLLYHWFAYAHMAMTSLVGHIDLAVVSLRLAVPALCAAAIVLTGVIGWRLAGRPYAGVGAALLFWVVGEITFTDPVAFPFGTQSMFVVWHGVSMIYSWVLLLALIMAVVSALRTPRPATFALVAVLALASSGAKASSLPVVLLALGLTGLVRLIAARRIPWTVVGLGVIVTAAQLTAAAVLYRFKTYGLAVDPLANLDVFRDSGIPMLVVFGAFAASMLVKYVGALPLLRRPLDPDRLFLLGGALAGPALYLTISSLAAQYFTRAGFTFGMLAAGWGWVLVLARFTAWQRRALVGGAAVLAGALVAVQLAAAPDPLSRGAVRPIAVWVLMLGVALGAGVAIWYAIRLARPGLRGRGVAVAMTAILVAGAPAFVMDMAKSRRTPNGGAYFNIDLPKSRVDAARWVRDHSEPSDVLATNSHCISIEGPCAPLAFWLTAYAEREVLVEGWGFEKYARQADVGPDWEPDPLPANERAFEAPTPDLLATLRDDHGVRWLVVDRKVKPEPAALRDLAKLSYDNGRIAVYRLR